MSNRRRQLQDDAAKVCEQIEALRALQCETDAEASARDERLEELTKRADEIAPKLERENHLDAQLKALRSGVADNCDSRQVVEKPAAREMPSLMTTGGFESRADAEKAGLFLRGLRDGVSYRAMGETSTAFDGKGAEYVPIELYSTVINRIKYSSVAMQVASVFNAQTNRITLPKVGDATASFVTDGTASSDQDLTTSGVTVNVLEMRASIAVGNALIDDSPVDVAALVAERLALAYATKIDSAWLSGDATSGVSIGGLYAGVTSGNKVTVGVNASTTAADLANVIGKVDPFVMNTAWVVSAQGWAELYKVAAGQIGTMIFGGSTPVPTVWGVPVYKVKGMPANVLALYGDFQFTSAVAVKANGLQITAARELLIRNNQTLFAGIQRVGISNHAPEYCAALVKATA
jgi:HK97 family phage major capsid protein